MSRAGAIVLLRGAVITVGVTVLVTVALSMLMRLPKEPTLRACALVLPLSCLTQRRENPTDSRLLIRLRIGPVSSGDDGTGPG